MGRSTEHDELSARCLTWLENKATGKGIRGQTEIALQPWFIADAVALCSFQYRFFKHYCDHSNLKMATNLDHRGAYNDFVCVFESKVSRQDFNNTFKSGKNTSREQHQGNLSWVVTTKGLVDPAELPDYWGLLEKSGQGLKEIKSPLIKEISQMKRLLTAEKLLWAIEKPRNYATCQSCGRYTSQILCSGCAAGRNGRKVD